MSLDLGGNAATAPLESIDELIGYLRSAEKPQSQWRVGVEHEKIGFTRDLKPIPYGGKDGIRALLEKLSAQGFGKLHSEAGNPIAVLAKSASITLEPGGQLELSGSPMRTLEEANAEIVAHLQAVNDASGADGNRWALLGYRPFGTTAQGEWMPKLRYNEMHKSLGSKGKYAKDMMLMTATVQANLDWSDEQDLAEKSRAATGVSAIVTSIFSNSPVVNGAESGFQDFRYEVWRDTDPRRCGLLEEMVRPDFGYAAYVNWAIDVPLLFVRHGGKYFDGAGMTFREWWKRGELPSLKLRPTVDSFADHLTTLFPEVRIKKVFELRGADVVPMPLLMSLPAIWMGLLYDRDSRDAAWALTSRWSWGERLTFQADVAKRSFAAQAPGGRSALELAKELLVIADRGLEAWSKQTGANERRYLDPARELVAAGHPLSEKLLSKWKFANRDPEKLISLAIADTFK
jgi:glutamate--cysteine ligase